ncbi:MAG: aromatic acid exporter family protein [Epulopiscium sp.]|nr:aromatic acid exporter family protein [Candidatus Epulonipiscium sp.]
MDINNKLKDINVLFFLKAGLGSAIAILLADSLGLAYSASAGIITLLTIQNTKKETILIALRRIVAFVIAVFIAYVLFSALGYTSIVFGLFIFIFVGVCNIFGLQDGIAMNSVLTTHFLIEKNMEAAFLLNEVAILLIGMSIGIGLNLIMPKYKKRLKEEQKMIEESIKRVLSEMADCLRGEERDINIGQLEDDLDRLLDKAYEEAENRFLTDTKYLVSYLEMRRSQVLVLKNIKDDIGKLNEILPQTYLVADYIEKVSYSFHELNDVKDLSLDLEGLYEYFRETSLPTYREEFENRAILFLILKEMEYFLGIKEEFSKQLLKQ